MTKQSTDKLLNLKRLICACEHLRPEEREAFGGIIDEVIYSCTPVVRGKFDLYKFTSSGPRGVLSGVFYDKGNIVASDGKVLAVIRQDYPSEREGLVIDKNGCKIDYCRYPNYLRVIPETAGWPSYKIDFQKAREIIRQSKSVGKGARTKSKLQPAPCKNRSGVLHAKQNRKLFGRDGIHRCRQTTNKGQHNRRRVQKR